MAASRPRSSWKRPPSTGPSRGPGEYGIGVDGWTVDFPTTQVRKRKVIDQLHKGLQGLLKRRKVVTFRRHRASCCLAARCG